MKNALREKAIRLRKKGLSYNEIRKEIEVSKSTLSLWLKGVLLKPEFRKKLYTKRIENLARGTMSQKERRKREVDTIIATAMDEISLPISRETYKLFGAALYWAEGTKKGEFKITNSDPRLILLMVHWLNEIFNINPMSLKAHLNIYSQQDDTILKKFWSDLTKIPLSNFGKSYIKPANKGFKKNILYYGTIQIYIPRGTDKKHRVFGWIKKILQNIEGEVILVERRWESLKNTPRPVNLPHNIEKPL